MLAGVWEGLECLQAKRIIHRGLKPGKILLQGSTPRLADFGISRVLKSISHSMTVAGSPAYMAPETFAGKRNERTDLWSVGVIFYQMLTGCLPFPHDDFPSLMRAILTQDPVQLPSSVPRPLQEFVTRLLDKDPARRYSSASESRVALLQAFLLAADSD